jgi:hypothetical protein
MVRSSYQYLSNKQTSKSNKKLIERPQTKNSNGETHCCCRSIYTLLFLAVMASALLDPASMSCGVAVSISSTPSTSGLFKVLAAELLDSAFMASFVILDFFPADFRSPALLPFGPGSIRLGRGGTSRGVGDGLRDKACERRRAVLSLLPNSCNR